MRDIRRRIVAVFILLVVAGAVLAAVRRPKPGLVLGTVGVGQSPRFAAVDVRTGHAFVVNMGGPQSATVTTTGAAASLAQGSFTPGSVSMIDTRSGTLIRTIDAGESPTAVAVDARHQRAYVLDAGSVYVLDTATGTLLRTISLRGGDDSLTVDPSTGHVYTASYTTGTVSMFDGGTGRLLQVVTVGQGVVGMLVDERTHRLFAESRPGGYGTGLRGAIGVIDTVSGSLVRRDIVGLSPDGMALDSAANSVYVLNGQEGTVSVLDASNGAVTRTVTLTAGGFPSGPGAIVVVERTRRAFVDHGWTSVFDTCTGKVLYTDKFSPVPGPIAIDRGSDRVFAASYRDGRVRVLDGSSGHVLRAVDMGIAPQDMVVDERGGRVYVVTPGPILSTAPRGAVGPVATRGPGRVYVLDGRSGAIRERATVGMSPVALAVSEQNRRILVLNMAGLTRASDPWSWVPDWARRRLPFIPRPPPTFQSANGSVSILDASQ